MTHLIDKAAVVAMIEKFMYGANLEADIASTGECFNEEVANAKYKLCKQIKEEINTIEVKEVDFCTISENLMEAHEYLDFTHTSNLAHNKPMVAARLKKTIQELYNAGLLKLTHDEKYRIESLGLKAKKGE